ncbi:hypothetical protein [Krasilnikovia sp. M28-CT-15]
MSLVSAGGTKVLLRISGASVSTGADPETEPFPNYVIPDAVKSWQAGRV